jgi:hypothetical protein
MLRGRMLCGRSKCALQCLRRCYRTRQELSSILLSRAKLEANSSERAFPQGRSEGGGSNRFEPVTI